MLNTKTLAIMRRSASCKKRLQKSLSKLFACLTVSARKALGRTTSQPTSDVWVRAEQLERTLNPWSDYIIGKIAGSQAKDCLWRQRFDRHHQNRNFAQLNAQQSLPNSSGETGDSFNTTTPQQSSTDASSVTPHNDCDLYNVSPAYQQGDRLSFQNLLDSALRRRSDENSESSRRPLIHTRDHNTLADLSGQGHDSDGECPSSFSLPSVNIYQRNLPPPCQPRTKHAKASLFPPPIHQERRLLAGTVFAPRQQTDSDESIFPFAVPTGTAQQLDPKPFLPPSPALHHIPQLPPALVQVDQLLGKNLFDSGPGNDSNQIDTCPAQLPGPPPKPGKVSRFRAFFASKATAGPSKQLYCEAVAPVASTPKAIKPCDGLNDKDRLRAELTKCMRETADLMVKLVKAWPSPEKPALKKKAGLRSLRKKSLSYAELLPRIPEEAWIGAGLDVQKEALLQPALSTVASNFQSKLRRELPSPHANSDLDWFVIPEDMFPESETHQRVPRTVKCCWETPGKYSEALENIVKRQEAWRAKVARSTVDLGDDAAWLGIDDVFTPQVARAPEPEEPTAQESNGPCGRGLGGRPVLTFPSAESWTDDEDYLPPTLKKPRHKAGGRPVRDGGGAKGKKR